MKTSIDYTKLTKLGTYRNAWRERDVTLYAHPTDETKVISVGVGIHDKQEIVCEEDRSSYRRQLVFKDWSTFQ